MIRSRETTEGSVTLPSASETISISYGNGSYNAKFDNLKFLYSFGGDYDCGRINLRLHGNACLEKVVNSSESGENDFKIETGEQVLVYPDGKAFTRSYKTILKNTALQKGILIGEDLFEATFFKLEVSLLRDYDLLAAALRNS